MKIAGTGLARISYQVCHNEIKKKHTTLPVIYLVHYHAYNY